MSCARSTSTSEYQLLSSLDLGYWHLTNKVICAIKGKKEVSKSRREIKRIPAEENLETATLPKKSKTVLEVN